MRPPVKGLNPPPTAALREPTMRLHYNSKSPYRGDVVIAPNAIVDVPDELAEQLMRDAHFQPVADEDLAALRKAIAEQEAAAAAAVEEVPVAESEVFENEKVSERTPAAKKTTKPKGKPKGKPKA